VCIDLAIFSYDKLQSLAESRSCNVCEWWTNEYHKQLNRICVKHLQEDDRQARVRFYISARWGAIRLMEDLMRRPRCAYEEVGGTAFICDIHVECHLSTTPFTVSAITF
jgi:hypothetical protein